LTIERATEVFAVVNLAVIGVSHIAQPRVWVEFFIFLRERGHAGVFFNGMLSLTFGSILAAFHNVWAGLPMIVTLLGWAQVLKGLISLVAPSIGLKKMMRVSMDRAWEFQVAGAVLAGLAGLIAWTWVR
jgi:hypothetical protein